jgi:hypothetical protein
MKEKKIVIEIDEQGNCSMDLEGFQGKGCADVAKDFQGSDVVKNVRNKQGVLHPKRLPARSNNSLRSPMTEAHGGKTC